ncbi:MAG: molybdopterin molybdotransferase MoeA, partial [Alphaproteobacteria bacterium]|nr:molybdopterin molybdotransferase MoeA [Alphaproteobacteria bacterium]
MTQLSKDGGDLIGVEAALAAVQKLCRPVTEVEAVALSAGLGRILAADVTAPRDVPPTDNSAVDGYALYFDDLNEKAETTLPVTGRAAAGHPLDRPAQRGEAVRIFTGAAMPTGAAGEPGPDTVAMQEDCKAISGAKGAEVVVLPGLKRGGNARHKGEDVAAGSVVLTAGQRLRPQDLGLAASVGLRQLDVFAPLKVAIFSTGDEICDPGGELPPGGIYDANRTCIMALLQGLGCEITDLGILADDP